jgi:hypothetical protein
VANSRSNKRDIDRAKKERAALKRARRQHSEAESTGATTSSEQYAGSASPTSETDVLGALDALHGRFAAGEVDFDEFEASKFELLDRLGE